MENVAGDLKGWKVLDIGCGDGYLVNRLLKEGVDAYGCDITLAGIPNPSPRFRQCPAWRLPYKDGEFELTITTDVLEHIPEEMIPQVAREIQRITSRISVHIIATFPERKYQGHEVHLTVRPMEWWAQRFKGSLIERTEKGWHRWQ